jgi:ElaB/YqjD/DUF883 family membrane-anchored ribosome-binding protein
MSSSNPADPTLANLQEDVAALKRDLSSLLSHLTSGASSGAQAASDQIGDHATRLYNDATAGGARSMKAISRQVEEQPLLALLVVLGIGFVGGRLLSR